jgi:hypothetical protein
MDIGELKSLLARHNDNEKVWLHDLVTHDITQLQHDDTIESPAGLYLMIDIDA